MWGLRGCHLLLSFSPPEANGVSLSVTRDVKYPQPFIQGLGVTEWEGRRKSKKTKEAYDSALVKFLCHLCR